MTSAYHLHFQRQFSRKIRSLRCATEQRLKGIDRVRRNMFATKVHPFAKKQDSLRSQPPVVSSPASSNAKKLLRVPHVFANVLVLPLRSDSDVSVEETPDSFRYIAAANGIPSGVRVHTIEILPGMTRIVIKGTDGGELVDGHLRLGLDVRRFRLPARTRPAMATAVCSSGKLVVTVPKTTAGK